MRSVLLLLVLAAVTPAADPTETAAPSVAPAASERTATERRVDAQYERLWVEAEGWKAFADDLKGPAWARIDPTFKGKVARERLKRELERYRNAQASAERQSRDLAERGAILPPGDGDAAMPVLRKQLNEQRATAERMQERARTAWLTFAEMSTEPNAAAAKRATVVWLDALAEQHRRAAKVRRWEQVAGR